VKLEGLFAVGSFQARLETELVEEAVAMLMDQQWSAS
jgi:hypothetical protein